MALRAARAIAAAAAGAPARRAARPGAGFATMAQHASLVTDVLPAVLFMTTVFLAATGGYWLHSVDARLGAVEARLLGKMAVSKVESDAQFASAKTETLTMVEVVKAETRAMVAGVKAETHAMVTGVKAETRAMVAGAPRPSH